PNWEMAKKLYAWLGSEKSRETVKIKSLHDVSDGGVLVTVAEGMIARGLGASISFPDECDPWDIAFGEGFHTFIATVSESEAKLLEDELKIAQIPFRKLGSVTKTDRLEVRHLKCDWRVSISEIRSAWKKEGYWE
ncbi:MAG: AIR synthase-related protein, partial [Bdellovibrionota bacterium]